MFNVPDRGFIKKISRNHNTKTKKLIFNQTNFACEVET